MMKKTSVFALMAVFSGCSMSNHPAPPNLESMVPAVSRFTELSARVAFANDNVKVFKDRVCLAVEKITPLLENYHDSDATFVALRAYVLRSVDNLPATTMTADQRRIMVLVMDQILDVVFQHVQESYNELIASNPVQSTLIIAKAVSTGLHNACVGTSMNLKVERSDTAQ